MNVMSGKSVDFPRALLFLRGGMPFLVAGETFSETEYHSAAVTSGAVERFAGAHPSHFVGPFHLQGRGWPCLSTGT